MASEFSEFVGLLIRGYGDRGMESEYLENRDLN